MELKIRFEHYRQHILYGSAMIQSFEYLPRRIFRALFDKAREQKTHSTK